MKNLLLLTLIGFLAVSCSTSRQAAVKTKTINGQKWKLVWSDEFDYEGLPDPGKWSFEVGYIRNRELQYYTEKRMENARVENGHLLIEGIREPYKDHKYTSASIHTQETATWQYGRFEIRAKLPTGRGTWPAIWMLGNNRKEAGWPKCGEIDIMENVGFDPDRIHANVHTEAYNHVKKTNKGNKKIIDKPYEQFYTYAVEWTSQKMTFFIDDEAYFTFENEGTGEATWPFDQPFYLKINLAIGGGWGGQQGVDDDIFPQQYLIDYVRVYQ